MIPLTSDTPRLRQHVLRSPVARRHANALPTKAAQMPMALRHHERTLATRSVHTLKQTYHTIPPMIPLTSDTPRLRQHVSRSPVARRHANALPTKAAQIPMALRHHERTLATRSVHTLEANISHDTANDPAHQRHAAFTPACFALPSGTAPRKRTSHQGRANPNGTATSRTYFGHTSHSSSDRLFPGLLLYYKLATSESSSKTLFPVLHLYYKLATSESISERLFPVLWPLLSPAPKSFFPHYFCTTNWPLLSPAPKSSFPHYICTTNWPLPQRVAPDRLPLLNPALKGSFPDYICTTNWPLLSAAPKSSCPYYICTTSWPLLSPSLKGSFPHYICTTNWPLLQRLRPNRTSRTLACTSRPRHARSPQRVAPDRHKSHSRLHFAHSTRTISAEGCAHMGQIALSPAFRALDTHDRSPHHLQFAHSTRAISAEGCAHMGQIALSPAFRALDTHDLPRGLRRTDTNRTLACISRTRHARFSAEGCAGMGQIALSPAFRAPHARSPQRVAFSVDAVRPTLRL